MVGSIIMNFVEEERVYCNKDEEQEEEEQEQEEEAEQELVIRTSKLPFPSPSSSSSSTKHKSNFQQQHHNLWLASFESQQDYKKNKEAAVVNFDNKLELMDLSLRNTNNIETVDAPPGGGAEGGASGALEREHMFDKVVTPSDVGKLNRLVIPKQHAEKYFPLDSSSNEKGLLLNFEDRNGKPWRFRYSYWNSSQSYVMTKGWSRFVKEKKLDAGDIVSFQRGVGESGKHRLFIDWRRRPNAPDPTSFVHLDLQNQLVKFPQSASVRWGRLYSLPQPLSMPPQFEQPQILQHHWSYSSSVHQPYSHQHQHQHQHHHHHHNHNHQYYFQQSQYPQQPQHATNTYGNAAQHYLTSAVPGEAYHQIGSVPVHQQGRDHHAPMVTDSVPVVHGKRVGKRLRLFGVNVECPTEQDESSSSVTITHGGTMGSFSPHLASSSSPSSLQMPTMQDESEFSKKGKTSLSFDLDL